MTIRGYLSKLADKTPAPGGGSAAALAGALGSALFVMSAKYIMKRAKTAASRGEIASLLKSGESASRRLTALMREDEKAYYKLAGEIKRRRPKKLLQLYKGAINAPLEICMLSAQNAFKCAKICSFCKTLIMSDIVEAVILCEAAFSSAKLNVKINLSSIEDAAYKDKINRKISVEEKNIKKAKKAVLARAQKFLRWDKNDSPYT